MEHRNLNNVEISIPVSLSIVWLPKNFKNFLHILFFLDWMSYSEACFISWQGTITPNDYRVINEMILEWSQYEIVLIVNIDNQSIQNWKGD